MATATKLNGFVEHRAEGVHNFQTCQFVIALSNTAANLASVQASTAACVRATLTEISYTNASSRNVTTTSSSQTSGTYDLVLADLTVSASGGSVGPFQYVYLYNDTPTSPADPLVMMWDLGAAETIANGDARLFNFSAYTIRDS